MGESNNPSIPIHNVNFSSSQVTISKEDLGKMKIFGIGQIDNKWIVTRLRQYIILIDRHAADERVRVERLTSFLCGLEGPIAYRIKSTKLNNPHQLYVEYGDLQILDANARWIRDWGFGYKIVAANRNGDGNKAKVKVFQVPMIYGTAIVVDELR